MAQLSISREELKWFVEKGHTGNEIALILGVSRSTIHRRLRQYHMSPKHYSTIDDNTLENIILKRISRNKAIGCVLLQGMLTGNGVHLPRRRVESALARLYPEKSRFVRKIKRRQYWVRAPLSMVHVDTHHKLKEWRFVVHGGIDGYSRRWFYLNVASDNKASTALKYFKNGAKTIGLPSRVRCDKGMENIEIGRFMIRNRGVNRNSIMTGKSVHNVRIESNWRGVFEKSLHTFYSLFKEMEHFDLLNSSNELDLYCLHMCFKHLIQKELDIYSQGWNNHKLRTEGYQTPNQLFHNGIQQLRSRAEVLEEQFTELDQDFGTEDDVSDSAEDQFLLSMFKKVPLIVPKIRSSLTREQHNMVRSRFLKDTIVLDNVVDKYQEMHDFVTFLCQ